MRVKNHQTPPTIRPERDLTEGRCMTGETKNAIRATCGACRAANIYQLCSVYR